MKSEAKSAVVKKERKLTAAQIRKNEGLAGKYKTLHGQVHFVNRTSDSSLGVQCDGSDQIDPLSVRIQTNIPMQEKMEDNERVVIASRVLIFRVEIDTYSKISDYFTILDVVYVDSGERVECILEKNNGMNILEDETMSRFDSADGSGKKAFASFSVKFRETNRQHIYQEKGKKIQRKFCFRVTVFKSNFYSEVPSVQRCYVADSLSFNVLERMSKTGKETSTPSTTRGAASKKRTSVKAEINSTKTQVDRPTKKIRICKEEPIQSTSSILPPFTAVKSIPFFVTRSGTPPTETNLEDVSVKHECPPISPLFTIKQEDCPGTVGPVQPQMDELSFDCLLGLLNNSQEEEKREDSNEPRVFPPTPEFCPPFSVSPPPSVHSPCNNIDFMNYYMAEHQKNSSVADIFSFDPNIYLQCQDHFSCTETSVEATTTTATDQQLFLECNETI